MPATKQTTATKTKRTKTSPKKSASAKPRRSTKAAGPRLEISAEERWRMIAVTAYHKAEKRGFASGKEMDDWLSAEREVDELLGNRR